MTILRKTLLACTALLAISAPAKAEGEMKFAWHPKMNIIYADGYITENSHKKLQKIANKRYPLKDVTVMFNSVGGAVNGAMDLGRAIRDLKFKTSVGRQAEGGGTEPGICWSMCPYAMLGGVDREVPEGSDVAVHQIWVYPQDADPSAFLYSHGHLTTVQKKIGFLLEYLREMGASSLLLELGAEIPPWEPMLSLSRSELKRIGLSSWGPIKPEKEEKKTRLNTSHPTWKFEKPFIREWENRTIDGLPVVMRSHPLSIGGNFLGNMELAVSCGFEDRESYFIHYMDERVFLGGKKPKITIQVGNTKFPLETKIYKKQKKKFVVETGAITVVPPWVVNGFGSPEGGSFISVEIDNQMNPFRIIVGARNFQASTYKLKQECGYGESVPLPAPRPPIS